MTDPFSALKAVQGKRHSAVISTDFWKRMECYSWFQNPLTLARLPILTG
jgi:hypothetical protein